MKALQRPKVSVVIAFLNGSQWLIEAIESVINQSYPDWEAVLVDDGSDEEHSKVARDYSVKYAGKIIYTDHPGHINRGVTVSRNAGINLTNGEYIAFLDADDAEEAPVRVFRGIVLVIVNHAHEHDRGDG